MDYSGAKIRQTLKHILYLPFSSFTGSLNGSASASTCVSSSRVLVSLTNRKVKDTGNCESHLFTTRSMVYTFSAVVSVMTQVLLLNAYGKLKTR